jgi:hypothetical protein
MYTLLVKQHTCDILAPHFASDCDPNPCVITYVMIFEHDSCATPPEGCPCYLLNQMLPL